MESTILVRAGSFLASPRKDGVRHSGSGDSFLRRRCTSALHFETEGAWIGPLLRRSRSEVFLARSNCSPRAGVRALTPAAKVEEEGVDDLAVKWCDLRASVPMRPQGALVEQEQAEYADGGSTGKGKNTGGSGKGRDGESCDRDDNRRISDYYQQMLQIDPANPLLLRNYGRFLHEVEGDAEAAEECYGRAILASPRDGEVLCLYGELLWEIHRDVERAKAYFERAVKASPNDCYVLGSYAHFLWDAEEEEEKAR
ncbi:uncharacterized protein LOC122053822 [Zingiber officinale]|uniref:TmcB/TmcC TPR repeats domain-containing protein n=1 Tax=Zingiber officinale TaxID=94328 RepID=A0A8J5HWF0_ZINOF|nr:uncharacterized protein LOC122053822 [Zingiber officinale]KAG6521241.1 hypothetical protein ZIOFF_018352 [Zingiber officinale]